MPDLKDLIRAVFDAEMARKKAAGKLLKAQVELLKPAEGPPVTAETALERLVTKRTAVQDAEKEQDKALLKEEKAREKLAKKIADGTGWPDKDIKMLSEYALGGKRPR
jgi:hypothetical protein